LGRADNADIYNQLGIGYYPVYCPKGMNILAIVHQLTLIGGFIVHKIQANDQVVIEHDFLLRPLASPQGNFSSQCLSNYTSQCKILNGEDGKWIGELVSN